MARSLCFYFLKGLFYSAVLGSQQNCEEGTGISTYPFPRRPVHSSLVLGLSPQAACLSPPGNPQGRTLIRQSPQRTLGLAVGADTLRCGQAGIRGRAATVRGAGGAAAPPWPSALGGQGWKGNFSNLRALNTYLAWKSK